MFKQHNIITAVELGTSKLCVLIGEYQDEELNVIGFAETTCTEGMVKGEIFSMDAVQEKLIEALETGKDFSFGGNVMNNGLITNLPNDCCVEVTCLANAGGIQPCHIGDLPHQLAALNMRQISVHQLVVDAALTGKKEYIYQAALLDPHASSDLTIDEIRSLVDDLIEAHGDWLPEYH